MSRTPRQRGRLLLLFYSRSWRERYGDELLDLLADTRITLRTALDVAAAGIRQRLRAAGSAINGGTAMTIGPAWRHPTAFALVGALLLLPTFFFVGASLLAYELDVGSVRSALGPVMDAMARWRPLDLLLVSAPPVAAIAALAPLVRLGVERRDGALQAVITVRALALNAVVALVAILLAGILVWHIVVESVLEARA